MKPTTQNRNALRILVLTLISLSCVKPKKQEPAATGDQAASKPAISGPNARELCQRPKAVTSDPKSIEDVIELLNKMPKPVTVACFLDVLERPLYVSATANPISGQPATSAQSPRIFLMVGTTLIISVVPSGTGGGIIEFGYKTDSAHSIKGELKFPVLETLADDAAYTSILDPMSEGTFCRICHFPEVPSATGFSPHAYTSKIVPPIDAYDVPLKTLKAVNELCKTEKKDECEVIQSIFAQDEVIAKGFL